MPTERKLIILILIFLSFLLFSGCLNIPRNIGSDCRYEKVTVWIDSMTSNISIEVIQNEFINDDNISIIEKVDNDSWYILLNNSVSMINQENSSRIDTLCHFRTREIEILLRYHSQKPLYDRIYTDEDKVQWERKVDDQYYMDKEVLDQYMNSLLQYLNIRYNLIPKDIEYVEKYSIAKE